MTEKTPHTNTNEMPYQLAKKLVIDRIQNIEDFFSIKKVLISDTPYIILPNIIDALMQDSSDPRTRRTVKEKVLSTLERLKSAQSILTEEYDIKMMGKKVQAVSLDHAYILLAELVNQPDIISLTPQQRTLKRKNKIYGNGKLPNKSNTKELATKLSKIKLSDHDHQLLQRLNITDQQFIQMLINRQNNELNKMTMPIILTINDRILLNALIDEILAYLG